MTGHHTPPVSVTPPSRVIVCPVTQEASSESRWATRRADVLGDAQALEGVRRGHLVLATVVQRLREAGLDHRGGDRVDADPGAELDGELLGEVDEHRLAGAVHRDARCRPEAADRGDVDDAAAVLAHPGRWASWTSARAARQLTSKILRAASWSSSISGPNDRVDAGVVDQQVEAAERLDRAGHRLGAVGGVADVAATAIACVGAAQAGDGLRERLGLAGGEADAGALLDEPLGDGQADAAAGPGDEGGLAGEPLHRGRRSVVAAHGVLPAGAPGAAGVVAV